jgi:hypothetical protein
MRRFSGRFSVEVGAFCARLNPEVHRQVANYYGRCRPDLQVGAIYTSSFETGQKGGQYFNSILNLLNRNGERQCD